MQSYIKISYFKVSISKLEGMATSTKRPNVTNVRSVVKKSWKVFWEKTNISGICNARTSNSNSRRNFWILIFVLQESNHIRCDIYFVLVIMLHNVKPYPDTVYILLTCLKIKAVEGTMFT